MPTIINKNNNVIFIYHCHHFTYNQQSRICNTLKFGDHYDQLCRK